MMEQDRGAIVQEPVIEGLTEDQKLGIMKYVSQLMYTATLGIAPIGGKDIFLPTTQRVRYRDSGISVFSPVDGRLQIIADTTVYINSPEILIDEFIEHEGDPNTYIRYEADSIKVVAGNLQGFQNNATGVAFFGKNPIAKGVHIADATDLASSISQLNLLLAQIEAYGLLATS